MRVTTIENESSENKVSKFIYQSANMRTGKSASTAEYRMDKQFQNFLIFLISIFFQIEETLTIFYF